MLLCSVLCGFEGFIGGFHKVFIRVCRGLWGFIRGVYRVFHRGL